MEGYVLLGGLVVAIGGVAGLIYIVVRENRDEEVKK